MFDLCILKIKCPDIKSGWAISSGSWGMSTVSHRLQVSFGFPCHFITNPKLSHKMNLCGAGTVFDDVSERRRLREQSQQKRFPANDKMINDAISSKSQQRSEAHVNLFDSLHRPDRNILYCIGIFLSGCSQPKK